MVCLASLTAMSVHAQDIIPRPQQMKLLDGGFSISSETTLVVEHPALLPSAEFLKELVEPHVGALEIVKGKNPAGGPSIVFRRVKDKELGAEGYKLGVTPGGVMILANTDQGAFYGVCSLRQLFPVSAFRAAGEGTATFTVPGVMIVDAPRFSWRGGHLDVGRHYMPKEFVLRYIDLLAMHKFNKMHWHLTDDQGWRIEIKKYPKLTEIGSQRTETAVPGSKYRKFDGKPHGGFYTQEEIKEIVAYAQKRHVVIIPEIEFPGHSLAAIAAYPELGCLVDAEGKPVQHKVWTRWGVSKHICNPSDETIRFMKEVFQEVAALFPGPYFHIGGDEAPLDQWKSNDIARKKRKDLKLADERQLQSYILNDLANFLEKLGKRPVGWSDILHEDLSRNTVIMPYHDDGSKGAEKAIASGHQVVMAPTYPTYFDYTPGDDGDPAMGKANPIDKVYGWDPVLSSIPKDKEHLVVGSQFHCWTEMMPTPSIVEKRVYPRACAMAEVLWTNSDRKDFENFQRRLKIHNNRLLVYGLQVPVIRTAGEGWDAEKTPATYSELEWDVTSQIKAKGKYRVEFGFDSGENGLDVRDVALCWNGRVLTRDTHDGFAGENTTNSVYTLSLKDWKPGKFILKVKMRGRNGTDSAGTIYIDKTE